MQQTVQNQVLAPDVVTALSNFLRDETTGLTHEQNSFLINLILTLADETAQQIDLLEQLQLNDPGIFSSLITTLEQQPANESMIRTLLANQARLGLTRSQLRQLIAVVERQHIADTKGFASFIAQLRTEDPTLQPVILARVRAASNPASMATTLLQSDSLPEQLRSELQTLEPDNHISAQEDLNLLATRFAENCLSLLTDECGDSDISEMRQLEQSAEKLQRNEIYLEICLAEANHVLNTTQKEELYSRLSWLIDNTRRLSSAIRLFNRQRLYPAYAQIREQKGFVSSEHANQLLGVIKNPDLPEEEQFSREERLDFINQLAQAASKGCLTIDETLATQLLSYQAELDAETLTRLIEADHNCLLSPQLLQHLRYNQDTLHPTSRQVLRLVTALAANANPKAQELASDILSGGHFSSSTLVRLRYRLRETDNLAELVTSSDAMLESLFLKNAPIKMTETTRNRLLEDCDTLLRKSDKTYHERLLIMRIIRFVKKHQSKTDKPKTTRQYQQLDKIILDEADNAIFNVVNEDINSDNQNAAGRFLLNCYLEAHHAGEQPPFDLTSAFRRAMIAALPSYSASATQDKIQAITELLQQAIKDGSSDNGVKQLIYVAQLQRQLTGTIWEPAVTAATLQTEPLKFAFTGQTEAVTKLTRELLDLFVREPDAFNRLVVLEPVYQFVACSADLALKQTLNATINPQLPQSIQTRVNQDEWLQAELRQPSKEPSIPPNQPVLRFSLNNKEIAAGSMEEPRLLVDGLRQLQQHSGRKSQPDTSPLEQHFASLQYGVEQHFRPSEHWQWDDETAVFPEGFFSRESSDRSGGQTHMSREEMLLQRRRIHQIILNKFPEADIDDINTTAAIDSLIRYGHSNGYAASLGASLQTRAAEEIIFSQSGVESTHTLQATSHGFIDRVSLTHVAANVIDRNGEIKPIGFVDLTAHIEISAKGIRCSQLTLSPSSMIVYLNLMKANDSLNQDALLTHLESLAKTERTQTPEEDTTREANIAALMTAVRDDQVLPDALEETALYQEAQTIQKTLHLLELLEPLGTDYVDTLRTEGLQGLFTRFIQDGIVLLQEDADFLVSLLSEHERADSIPAIIQRYLALHSLNSAALVTRLLELQTREELNDTSSPETIHDDETTQTVTDPDCLHSHQWSEGSISVEVSPLSDEESIEKERLVKFLAEPVMHQFIDLLSLPTSMQSLVATLKNHTDSRTCNTVLDWLYESCDRIRQYPELLDLLPHSPEHQIQITRALQPITEEIGESEIEFTLKGEQQYSFLDEVNRRVPPELDATRRTQLTHLVSECVNAIEGRPVARNEAGETQTISPQVALGFLNQLRHYLPTSHWDIIATDKANDVLRQSEPHRPSSQDGLWQTPQEEGSERQEVDSQPHERLVR